MATKENLNNNLTMPDCTIIPVLQYKDFSEAVSWLCDKFDFKIRWQVGNHRAQLIYGDGVVVVTELNKKTELSIEKEKANKSYSILVRVKDVNKHFENSKLKGAEILQEPTDFFYGERQYSAIDIDGNNWTFSETIKELLPEEWGATSPVKV